MSINKNLFIDESNPSLGNKSPFHEKRRSTIYVEGYDDLLFYKKYLDFYYRDLLFKPNIYYLRSKKEVLNSFIDDINNKNKYIVDSDYDSKQELIDKGVIVTTGYSMENFYFYIDSNANNIKSLMRLIYDKLSNKKQSFDKFYENFLKELNLFYDNSILFFAYMKTLHSLGRGWSKDVRELFERELDYSTEIDNELSSLNDFERELIKYSIESNVRDIKESGYMQIRGHNIFDFMIDYLSKDESICTNINIKDFILTNSDILFVPEEFEIQFR